ncbi:hypothetical protein VNO77_33843 [Canavalia gladiata]|uniref:Uncharacterized protein n=1 Tax=Canavalia gladiata TaxID=3824 RepID=A0AAN9Q163_CANGL
MNPTDTGGMQPQVMEYHEGLEFRYAAVLILSTLGIYFFAKKIWWDWSENEELLACTDQSYRAPIRLKDYSCDQLVVMPLRHAKINSSFPRSQPPKKASSCMCLVS